MTGILKVDTIQSSGGTTGLTINSNGLIKPKTASFVVEATNTDQSAAGGAATKIQWETVSLDTGSYWDASNHRYTPAIAGWYLFGGFIRVNCTSQILSLMNLMYYKNGSENSRQQFQFNSDIIVNGSYPLPTSMIQLNGSGDYVEAFIEIDETITIHDNSNIASKFWGMLVHAT